MILKVGGEIRRLPASIETPVIGTLNCMSKIQTEKAPSTLLSKEGHNMHKLSKGWSHWCLAGDK